MQASRIGIVSVDELVEALSVLGVKPGGGVPAGYVPPESYIFQSQSQTEQQNWVDQGLYFTDRPADYPDGYYKIPQAQSTQVSGVVAHSYPIVADSAGSGFSSMTALIPGQSGYQYIGPAGRGNVSIGKDSGIVCENANMQNFGCVLVNGVPGVAAVAAENGGWLGDNVTYFALNAFYLSDGSFCRISGRSVMITQASPSVVVLSAGQTCAIIQDSMDQDFITGDAWDFSAANPGDLNAIFNANSTGGITGVPFACLDDQSIKLGVFRNCNIPSGDIADFISGIDNRSINSTFTGNNFKNTRPGGQIKVENNAVATVNPGQGVYTKPAGVSVLSSNATRVSQPDNYEIQWDQETSEDVYCDVSGRITVPTGEHDFSVIVRKQGDPTILLEAIVSSADPFFFGSAVNGFGADFDTVVADPTDIFELEVACLTDGAVDWTVTNAALRLFLGGN